MNSAHYMKGYKCVKICVKRGDWGIEGSCRCWETWEFPRIYMHFMTIHELPPGGLLVQRGWWSLVSLGVRGWVIWNICICI